MNSNNRFFFIAIFVLALLSACNPAPKYVRPPATTPANFKEAIVTDEKTNTGWKLAQPGDATLRGKWWEIYNDPQLNALEEQVAISNQSLKASEANFRAARAQVVIARAALYPTIGSTPGYSNGRASGTLASTRGISTNNEYSLPFDISYTPDFWHRVRNAADQQAFTAQADAADVATALLSTQAALATDYFELRAVDMQKKILVETMQNYQQNVNLTTTLYKTGINSEQELVQAQNQLDTARAQTTDLGVARAQYEHAIATLIGKPPAELTIAEATFNPEPPPIPVGVPSTLLERRPDIAAEERLIAAANAGIGVARAAYYPSLTLSATGGVQSYSFIKWFSAPSRFWSLGPQLSYTIWEGGARRGQNEQAQAQYDAAVANYRQNVLTAFQSVEDQLSTLRILTQEIGEQQTAINSSQRYLDLAQVRFKAGVDSYLNVITAQNSLLANRESQVAAELRRLESSVQLVLALGGGWDPNSLPNPKDLAAKRPAAGQPAANSGN